MRDRRTSRSVFYQIRQVRPAGAQVLPAAAYEQSSQTVHLQFPTLVDCYEFLVGWLVDEGGFSVREAEQTALNQPLILHGFSLVITRRRARAHGRAHQSWSI